MKKLLAIIAVSAVALSGTIEVSAASTESNMDKETFLEMKLEQIKDFFTNGFLSQDEADELTDHVTEVAELGTFGQRRMGEPSEDCVLGEEYQGLFQGSNQGMGRDKDLGPSDGTGFRRGNGNGNRN